MGDEQIVISSGPTLSPETVLSRTFTSAFRGFHPAEVRQFLKQVSDEMAAGAGREVELRRALQEALHRAAHPDLDEDTVTTVLGEHAARLLASARETAASIAGAAQAQADAVRRDAELRVARMREEAEGLLARRMAEADAATATITQAAETAARAVADQARAEAEAVIEEAKQQGREMVAEARQLRERMLGDLTRRRRATQLQVEQLRAARDRLLAAYDVVRRTADEATSELRAAEPEARLAAEAVALRGDEPDGPAELLPAAELPPAELPAAELPAASPAPPRALAPAAARALPALPTLAAPPEDRPVPAVAAPRARAASLTAPAARPASQSRDQPVPVSALFRRMAEAPPPPPPAPERPPLRPQTAADALARPTPARPVRATLPPPPAAAASPAARRASPRPAAQSELATMENPAVSVEDPPPARTSGNGDHRRDGPDSSVDRLFARIRADRQPPPSEASVQPAPARSAVLDPIAGEQARVRRDDLLDNVEAGLTRALKRILQDEQNEVLDRLRRLGPSDPGAVLPDAGPQTAAYRDAALPWLQQAARAGIGFASDPVPGSEAEGAYPPREAQADELAAQLVGPLGDRLGRALDGADDESVAAESLRAAYRQWKVQQVEAGARHAVVVAFSAGAFAATPDAAALQWLVDDDGHCPDCDDNALAGPTPKGQPFPTGQLHPPAHPGCRCVLVPPPS
jgi:DivIVA domain-containing protein